ncbi:MAG TPA: hypothetical protein PKK40_02190 [Marmoricola sp.]|nr:hypothetical protein [Marmoricola sp.]
MRWAVVFVVLLTTGCGAAPAETKPKPAASPSPTAITPTNLPTAAPSPPPPSKKASDASATGYAKYVVRTFYYALTTRDPAPLTDLVAEGKRCRGCEDTAQAIDDLLSQKVYQVPGKIRFARAEVSGREDPRAIVTSLVRVRPGTWVSESDGMTGVLAGQKPKFTILLSWDDAANTWRLVDYTVTT